MGRCAVIDEEEWSEEEHVEWLNELDPPYDSDEWIMGGENRWDETEGKYGVAMRRFDPMAFRISYQDRRGGLHNHQ